MQKEYLLKDISGRGYTNVLTDADILNTFSEEELEYSLGDYWDTTLRNWINEDSEIGDTFTNEDDNYILTRIK